MCAGCKHPIGSDSPDLLPILKLAVQNFNKRSERHFLYALGEIIKATSQVGILDFSFILEKIILWLLLCTYSLFLLHFSVIVHSHKMCAVQIVLYCSNYKSILHMSLTHVFRFNWREKNLLNIG